MQENKDLHMDCWNEIKALQQQVNNLNNDLIAHKTEMTYLKREVQELEDSLGEIHTLSNSLQNMKDGLIRLERSFEKYSLQRESLLENFNSKMSKIESQIEKFPLLFQEKSKAYSLGDIVKASPSIIAILGAIGTLIWWFIRGRLDGN